MVKMLAVILVLGLLLVGSVCVYNFSTNETQNIVEEVQQYKVVNPKTGEVWDSVEDYVYRNKSKVVLNG